MVPVEKRRVDTLSLLDRLAIRTNIVDWALMLPNVGFEFDVKNTSWNRWTVGANVRYNWQTSHTYKPSMVFNLFQARIEGRQYWRTRDMSKLGLEKHKRFYEKAISIRRRRAKHPSFTWYRGVFAAYNRYSFLFGGEGHQGNSIMGGVTYGFIRPMFAFSNGNSLDLEFGVSGGAVYYKDQVYKHEAEYDCYTLIEEKPGQIMPMINEIRVGLVYRLGHAPVLSKYRYRRDADEAYDLKLHDLLTARTNAAREKRNYKMTRSQIEHHFWHVYDSVARADKAKGIAGTIEFAPPSSAQSSEQDKAEEPSKADKKSKKDKQPKAEKKDKKPKEDKKDKKSKAAKQEARKEGDA